ncbi:phosphoribosylanthranilate isomerase [Kaistia dalseonensis]|uniref:N-(5'-phosphoribosyl)anthranilate isomerase n=1 Tax=Kaistia dalseonensis TaxID=410840 RepID=A0ABU0H5F3_9HYPH|nr:phosphoribosylanthranilate isomerase [Kaistia dalseonensis]MCX5494939.1 phosphoribosylanthranilate isomerase [Kaistia dalseonensis]MDQ0437520.1 phosphoribosylanthranilate isomerase [Kaistia dalseonensis]
MTQSVIVKICGLSTEDTLDAALDAGVDMVGFNFFPKSPRFVTVERARELAARVRGRAEIVALTVNMDVAGIEAIVQAVRPDWLQFHGAETPAEVASAQSRFGLGVIKALGISSAEDLAPIADFSVADRLLLDAKPPKGATLPGGNGVPFDWRLLEALDPALSYMLSGGLDAGNVAEAVRLTRAPGVDVSSGVESAPGIKDPDRIRAFTAAARGSSKTPEEGREQAGERIMS